jgi:hypothetical protein
VDIEGSKKPLYARSPFLEAEAVIPDPSKGMIVASASQEKMKLIEELNCNSVNFADKVKHEDIMV